MQKLYSYLKGLLAATLLCTPVLVQADEAPAGLTGKYVITLGEATYTDDEEKGIYIEAFYDSEGTGELLSADMNAVKDIWFSFGADNTLVLENVIYGMNEINPDFYAFSGATAAYMPLIDQIAGDGKYYNLYNANFTTYAVYDPTFSETNVWAAGMTGGSDSNHALKDASYVTEVNLNSANQNWQLQLGENGEYYLYNVGAKKYLGTQYGAAYFSEEPLALTIAALDNDLFAFNSTDNSDSYACCSSQTNDSSPIAFWTSDDAGSSWAFVENTSAFLTSSYEVTEASPAPNSEDDVFETMPGTFTFTTNAETLSSATFTYQNSSTLRGVTLDESAVAIDGGTITVTLPEEAYSGMTYLRLYGVVKDADGFNLTYGETEGYVIAVYYAATVSNTFEMTSATPADGETVNSLASVEVVMNGADNNDFIGGFDSSKTISVTNADGEEVTTATIDWTDPSDFSVEASNHATITLAEEIKTDGTYTLTIPEATIYNSLFDDNYEDMGVSYGATYNPEIVLTYTVSYTETEPKPLGDPVTSLDEISEDKTYVLYNDHFTTYAVYDEASSTENLWIAGVNGEVTPDSGHSLYVTPATLDITNAGCSWMFFKKDGNYYLYNMGAERYLSTPTFNGSYPCTFTEEANALNVVELGDGKFAFSTNDDSKGFMCACLGTNPISIWTSDDAGSSWQFMENPNVEADATVISNTVTGIENAAVLTNAESIYTISGVKLNVTDPRKLSKGLYIIDGKKVIVK